MNPKAKKVLEILKKVKYLTLATVTEDGKPWNSPVFGAFDNR